MPSFKEKFETVRASLASMESRVLISESKLRELLSRVAELETEVYGKAEESLEADQQVIQINTQLEEIGKLLGIDTSLKMTSDATSHSDLFNDLSKSLHKITRHLRESSVRASTLLDGLVAQPANKLLSRGRREGIRKQSIASLATSLAQSPPRLMSPPCIGSSTHSRSHSSSSKQ